MDKMDEGDLEYILKRLLDEAETGLLRPDWWLMTDDNNDDNFLYKFVRSISHSKKNWGNYDIMKQITKKHYLQLYLMFSQRSVPKRWRPSE
jgi:hypothetical protein